MNGKFLLIFLFVVNLFAGVSAKVDKPNVIQGDSVVFSITASGNKIVFPTITSIGNNNIEAIGSSSQYFDINGKNTTQYTRTWTFTPIKSMIIPSYKVIANGKIYHTKPIPIKVVKDTKFDKNFKLEVIAPKKEIVGYPSIVSIKFFQKTNVNLSTLSLELPQGPWDLKALGKQKIYFKGVYKVTQINYLLIPKKEGKIPFRVRVKLGFASQQVDSFGFIVTSMKYKILQKIIPLNIKKVYNGIVGNFSINLKVDKISTNSNSPINGTLIIKGEGDLSNLGDIKLNIPNVTTYDNKPKITTIIKNDKIYSEYKKRFVLMSDKSFTIPPIEIKYFSIKENKVKTISTLPIHINIKKNSSQNINMVSNNSSKPIKNTTLPVKKVISTHTENSINIWYLLVAFIGGIIVAIVLLKLFARKGKISLPMNLYEKLLPYADDLTIKTILEKLYNKEKLTDIEKNYIRDFLKNKNKDK